MYKYGTHSEIIFDKSDSDYLYYIFNGISIRVSRSTFDTERMMSNGSWRPIKWSNNGSGQMRYSFYHDHVVKSLARCRLICTVAYGYPTGNAQFVRHKDGNTLNDSPQNLEWTTSLLKSKCKFRTPEMVEAISKIPESQRNWKNPEYVKLYNSMKGSDGLNHSDRFRLKQQAKGLMRKTIVVNGKKTYKWVPKDTPKQE